MTEEEIRGELAGARLIISVIADERGSIEIKHKQLIDTEPSTLEVRWDSEHETMTILHMEDDGAGVSDGTTANESPGSNVE